MTLAKKPSHLPTIALLSLVVSACGSSAMLSVADGTGAHPVLPPPTKTLIPTIEVVKAKGWLAGETPAAADGLDVQPFATHLNHPRWLYVLPNGDVLVAETNAPPRPEDGKGLKGRFSLRGRRDRYHGCA